MRFFFNQSSITGHSSECQQLPVSLYGLQLSFSHLETCEQLHLPPAETVPSITRSATRASFELFHMDALSGIMFTVFVITAQGYKPIEMQSSCF